MRRHRERATTLLEVTIATAIITIVVGAALNASIAAIRHFGPDPVQSALDSAAAREMRIAVDVLKYSGTSVPPSTISTTIPLASASPLPAAMSIQTTALPGGSLQLHITASTVNPTRSVTLVATLANRAPAPGSTLVAPLPIAQPLGDP